MVCCQDECQDRYTESDCPCYLDRQFICQVYIEGNNQQSCHEDFIYTIIILHVTNQDQTLNDCSKGVNQLSIIWRNFCTFFRNLFDFLALDFVRGRAERMLDQNLISYLMTPTFCLQPKAMTNMMARAWGSLQMLSQNISQADKY